MPELLLELFSEEIPARMQARAAEDLARLVTEALAALTPSKVRACHGPRRIALTAELNAAVPAASSVERGPRISAPEQALAGFLRKHGAARDGVVEEGGYWVLHKQAPAQEAAGLIAAALPALLRRFPWPKSMRWGGTGSSFTWVRPLRRILCLLDGAVVPFTLADGADDGHGLHSGNLTEGHRFMAPGPFPVHSAAEWHAGLAAKRVLVDAAERRRRVAEGVQALAAEQGLAVVDDPGLLDEVAGLVEWPVPLLGRIDPAFMDLPPEVMQVSMRVNQRYFALRTADGAAAPFFAFAANIETPDAGAAIIAGNERVLRARFSDARYFWDADRRVRLADRVAALDAVTFHAKLGSQGARVHRMMQLAEAIAPFVGADPALAARAALLAKADLTTGMVSEFPELQGVMGRYYAICDGEDPVVSDAIRDHYAPKGIGDEPPTASASVAVALAEKIDLITAFFMIGMRPTGSGDPFALRRAALGIVRIIFEGKYRIRLLDIVAISKHSLSSMIDEAEVVSFIIERMRVYMRDKGSRYDVIDAVLASNFGDDLQLVRYLIHNLTFYIETSENGPDLVLLYRRAYNILRIEEAKDGPHAGDIDPSMLSLEPERHLYEALLKVTKRMDESSQAGRYNELAPALGTLRHPLDNFFDRVTVNDKDPACRRNRLRLLHRLRATMDSVADFSRIEG